jgi:hypothetical protein
LTPDLSGGYINKIFPRGDSLYIAGTFYDNASVNYRVAKMSAIDGSLDAWNPGILDGAINDMEFKDATIFLGGGFSCIDCITGHGIILTETGGGIKIPVINGSVYTSISDDDGGWYIGGDFTCE